MYVRRRAMCVVALAVMLMCAITYAQDPLGSVLTYQGYLTDSQDRPLNDHYDMEFRLFDAPAGVNVVGMTTAYSTFVDAGLFWVQLDFGEGVFAGEQLWLEIRVRESGSASDWQTLSPRQEISLAPYADFAKHAGSVEWTKVEGMPEGFADDVDDDSLGGLTCAEGQFAQYDETIGWTCGDQSWQVDGDDLYYNTGRVGIGTNDRTHRLTVESTDAHALRLVGPETYGHGSKLNFGDADYVYLYENMDDNLTIRANHIALMGYGVGIGEETPDRQLDVVGDMRVDFSSGTMLMPTNEEGMRVDTSLHYAGSFVSSGPTGVGLYATGPAWGAIFDGRIQSHGLTIEPDDNVGDMLRVMHDGVEKVVVSTNSEGGRLAVMDENGVEKVVLGTSESGGMLIVQGQATASVQLPPGAINAPEIGDEPGLSHAKDKTWRSMTGVPESVLVRWSNIPAEAPQGYLMITGTCTVKVNHTSGTESYMNIGVNIGTSMPNNYTSLSLPASCPSGQYAWPVTVHSVYPVTPGGVYQSNLLVHERSGDFESGDHQLTVLFLPTAYGTVDND